MLTPLVYNDAYGDYWTTTTTLTSPFVNPYFVSTLNTPIRTHVSSLGTAVHTTASAEALSLANAAKVDIDSFGIEGDILPVMSQYLHIHSIEYNGIKTIYE